MKEIGPIPRKLWPFESTPGHPSCEWLTKMFKTDIYTHFL